MSTSVYQALRSAGYSDAGIIGFATSLITELCEDTTTNPAHASPLDVRTGLPEGGAFLEVLEFELSRTRSTCHHILGLILVTVRADELRPALERFEDEKLVVQALRSRMRTSDAFGCTQRREYVLMLRGAGARTAAATAVDLHRALAASSHRGTHFEVRHVSLASAPASAAAMLDAARRSDPVGDDGSSTQCTSPRVIDEPVVLAMCGGAARAAAHIGVLDALGTLGIEVSGIGATSAGALVAAMHAAGLDRDAMLERFASFSESSVHARIRHAYGQLRARDRSQGRRRAGARLGFCHHDAVAVADDDMLHALVEHFAPHDQPIEGMRVKLAFCVTDLRAGRTTYISHGSLHDGLRAACATPGLFPPQPIGDALLVDGSLAGELPVAAASSIADDAPVIGCWVERPTANPEHYPNGVAVAARAAAVRERELVCERSRACELVLRIPVEDVGWLSFARSHDAAEIGRTIALRSLEGRRMPPGPKTARSAHHPLSTP
ncbi:MAG: patatin-like phospholipase family protein [Myxococcota bacterium]